MAASIRQWGATVGNRRALACTDLPVNSGAKAEVAEWCLKLHIRHRDVLFHSLFLQQLLLQASETLHLPKQTASHLFEDEGGSGQIQPRNRSLLSHTDSTLKLLPTPAMAAALNPCQTQSSQMSSQQHIPSAAQSPALSLPCWGKMSKPQPTNVTQTDTGSYYVGNKWSLLRLQAEHRDFNWVIHS